MNEPTMTAADYDARLALPAGSMLRNAREAAGMTLDTVAQQLKLAPRQVTALEEGDYASLPGRTFVRGFVRNYARLLQIDPERVLAALPGGDTAALHSPVLHPTAPTIGDLPTEVPMKPGWTRWAIPIALIVVIVSGVAYELTRGRNESRPPAPVPALEPERKAAPAPSPAPAPPPAPNAATPAATPLANPLAPPSPATGTTAVATPLANPAATTAPAPAAADAANALTLTVRQPAWVEVKDANGRLLLSETVPAGQTRSVSGSPPYDLSIGNAPEVNLNFRGKPVDLAPYTRQNVARFKLQ